MLAFSWSRISYRRSFMIWAMLSSAVSITSMFRMDWSWTFTRRNRFQRLLILLPMIIRKMANRALIRSLIIRWLTWLGVGSARWSRSRTPKTYRARATLAPVHLKRSRRCCLQKTETQPIIQNPRTPVPRQKDSQKLVFHQGTSITATRSSKSRITRWRNNWTE